MFTGKFNKKHQFLRSAQFELLLLPGPELCKGQAVSNFHVILPLIHVKEMMSIKKAASFHPISCNTTYYLVFIVCSRTTVAKLETIGCTDLQVKWKRLGGSGKEAYASCKVENLCHTATQTKYKPEVTYEGRGSVFYDLVAAAPGCSVERHVRSRSPRQDVQPPSNAEKLITSTMTHNILDEHLSEPQLSGCAEAFYEADVKVDFAKACRVASYPQGSDEWVKERNCRITGSKCYEHNTYACRTTNADWDGKMLTLEKSKEFCGNAATRYGQKCEGTALNFYESMTEGEVVRCGLIVPPKCPWLGFSPDAVVMRDGRATTLV